jgi:hypothetical protein
MFVFLFFHGTESRIWHPRYWEEFANNCPLIGTPDTPIVPCCLKPLCNSIDSRGLATRRPIGYLSVPPEVTASWPNTKNGRHRKEFLCIRFAMIFGNSSVVSEKAFDGIDRFVGIKRGVEIGSMKAVRGDKNGSAVGYHHPWQKTSFFNEVVWPCVAWKSFLRGGHFLSAGSAPLEHRRKTGFAV